MISLLLFFEALQYSNAFVLGYSVHIRLHCLNICLFLYFYPSYIVFSFVSALRSSSAYLVVPLELISSVQWENLRNCKTQ